MRETVRLFLVSYLLLRNDLQPRSMKNLTFWIESYSSIYPLPKKSLFTGKQITIYVKAIKAGNENMLAMFGKE